MAATSESTKERWKDQNKRVDKSEYSTRIYKSKDIAEKRETNKVLRWGQAVQTKKDILK